MHDNIASSANANDFRVRQRFATTVELLNYAGAATDTAAVQNYFDNLRNNDPTGAGNDWLITTLAPGGGFLGTASVPQPIMPIFGDLPCCSPRKVLFPSLHAGRGFHTRSG